jgi:hypothetical protein
MRLGVQACMKRSYHMKSPGLSLCAMHAPVNCHIVDANPIAEFYRDTSLVIEFDHAVYDAT